VLTWYPFTLTTMSPARQPSASASASVTWATAMPRKTTPSSPPRIGCGTKTCVQPGGGAQGGGGKARVSVAAVAVAGADQGAAAAPRGGAAARAAGSEAVEDEEPRPLTVAAAPPSVEDLWRRQTPTASSPETPASHRLSSQYRLMPSRGFHLRPSAMPPGGGAPSNDGPLSPDLATRYAGTSMPTPLGSSSDAEVRRYGSPEPKANLTGAEFLRRSDSSGGGPPRPNSLLLFSSELSHNGSGRSSMRDSKAASSEEADAGGGKAQTGTFMKPRQLEPKA